MRPRLSLPTDYCARQHGIGLDVGPMALGPYLPGSPSAAYGMKRLIAGYSGPAINVTVGGNTADIPFSIINDVIDTTALYTLLGANIGTVNTVYDQTGNGNHMVAATITGTNYPVVLPSGYNSAVGRNGATLLATASGVSFTNTSSFGIPNIYIGWDNFLLSGTPPISFGYFTIPSGVTGVYNNSSAFFAGTPIQSTDGGPYFEMKAASGHWLVQSATNASTSVRGVKYGNNVTSTTNCTPVASASTIGQVISSSSSVVYQNGQAYYTGAGSASTTALTGGAIGGLATSPNVIINTAMIGFCFYPTAVTALQAASIDSVMRPRAGQANNLLIGDGDSIMYGRAAGFALNYLTTTAPLLNRGTWDIINLGIGGQTFATMNGTGAIANINALITAIPNWASYTNIVYLCNAGVNDLHTAPTNVAGGGATTWNTIAAPYYTAMKGLVSGGSPNIPKLKVVAMTIAPNNLATINTESGSYNGLLIAAAGTGVYDAYAEIGGTGVQASGGNAPFTQGQAPYFGYQDNAHLSPCGYQAVAQYIAAAINSLI
jgi:hypothetical protein